MALWNLGSVASELHNLIDDIPTSISGNTLIGLVDKKRLFMENDLKLGADGIGSVNIAEKYQSALLNWSAVILLGFMNTQGTDAVKVKLGELDVSKGGAGGSNLLQSAEGFEKMAQDDMLALKKDVRFTRVWGV